MRVLGIESASMVASVAIVEDGNLVAEYTLNHKKTHSQTLLPMIDEIVRMTETDLSELDGIAISAGPGSFTGLRIGSATAKGLGLALNKPLMHIPTLEGMAWQLWGCDGLVCPIMDARRGQVYGGAYDCISGELPVEVIPADAIDLREFLEKAMQVVADESTPWKRLVFLGDGVPVGKPVIEEVLNCPYCFAPAHTNRQRASAVAALGEVYLKLGKVESAEEHTPDYFRVSQAERERKEKEAKQNGSN
ncbi:MAG: tRNA (adenosine(37)-N6)-threonylcarbamoyltransferase complex dimerization subunit type 1 TsaB [Lachnospiraceae bacterium]|nr:tRNA (adenosine(37)-N6)-threonylcarbamoyltransferase complex dimerization subunit type 1 TsaB [Lachnospiraceae bacterium]